MKNYAVCLFLSTALLCCTFLGGCVQRTLTIDTNPQGAIVTLNDEEVGISPVTIRFEWYGDYNVIISKEGYETLKTHKELDRPRHDKFPFDFFAQILSSKQILDEYQWEFNLTEKLYPSREALIEKAKTLKEQL